jgi:orotidine-5'-phosphate decarboxylase
MHGTASRPSTTSRSPRMRDVPDQMADRLIVALDVPTPDQAESLVNDLDGVVSFYKIGLWLLFTAGTDQLIDRLISKGKKIFLDYKMFDIPETVSKGVTSARNRGIKFVTVHGDNEIMKAAVQGKGDSDFLKIFTITVLTSMNDADLREMGYRLTVKELIELRVRKSLEYGSDGIIASAADNPDEIRKLVANQGLLIATPGVRPAGSDSDDHKRLATPAEAIRGGADYIIMGRPIISHKNPRAQAEAVIADMEKGLSQQAAHAKT